MLGANGVRMGADSGTPATVMCVGPVVANDPNTAVLSSVKRSSGYQTFSSSASKDRGHNFDWWKTPLPCSRVGNHIWSMHTRQLQVSTTPWRRLRRLRRSARDFAGKPFADARQA
jgi:hypothetical protein